MCSTIDSWSSLVPKLTNTCRKPFDWSHSMEFENLGHSTYDENYSEKTGTEMAECIKCTSYL